VPDNDVDSPVTGIRRNCSRLAFEPADKLADHRLKVRARTIGASRPYDVRLETDVRLTCRHSGLIGGRVSGWQGPSSHC
jgi:hypothetical protein